MNFCRKVTRDRWRPARHLVILADKLMDLACGRITRLMVFMPPRHGKSYLCSRLFPAWYLINNPDKRVILTSYGASLAFTFSRRVREIVREHGQWLAEVELAEDSSAVDRWDLKGREGGLVAAGVGGPITGHGGDIVLVDDVIKNIAEANSRAYREAVWDWYVSTLRTRLEPGAGLAIIMTRWHHEDLAGRLLAEMESGGEQWEVLKLPALAEEGDPLGRAPGEPLWPERYDKKALEDLRKTLGSFLFSAIYQQRPSPDEGGMLKRSWWKFYRQAPAAFDEIIQSWDMAFKETSTSDYVVGQVWGRKGADKYLLDQVRDRMDFPATIQAVRSLSAKWPQARAKLVEDKANGPAVIATLKREIPGLIPVEPQGSKEARVAAVSPDIEAGNVYLPDPSIASWIGDFVEECAAFPNGQNDDQVDAMSQALLRLSQGSNHDPASLALLRSLKVHG